MTALGTIVALGMMMVAMLMGVVMVMAVAADMIVIKMHRRFLLKSFLLLYPGFGILSNQNYSDPIPHRACIGRKKHV